MRELVDGKFVTIKNLESGIEETGVVKRIYNKLLVCVNRNNIIVSLTPEALSMYQVMYVD